MSENSHEKFQRELSEIPNIELYEQAKEALSQLCKTGGNSFTMHVPPRKTDFDILFSEVLRRWVSAPAERHSLAQGGEEKVKCNCFGCWLHENYDYENESWWHKVDEEGEQPLETEELYQQYINDSLPKSDKTHCNVCGNLYSDDKGNCNECNPPIQSVQEF